MKLRTSVAPALISSSAMLVACFAGCAATGDDLRILGFEPGPSPGFTAPEEDGGTSDASGPTFAMCVATECPSPHATCPAQSGSMPNKCETNLLVDDLNCGACGNVCSSDFPELNMRTRCVDGACRAACEPFFQDCNGLADDGCEVNFMYDSANCGACGNQCPELAKGVSACAEGECRTCSAPKTFCSPICTDTSSDDNNCGTCGNRCPPPPADAKPPPPQMKYGCRQGECGKLVCLENWADCNNDPEDGCEINLRSDPKNCATCGNACAPGQVCTIRLDRSLVVPVCACEPNETLCTNGRCVDLLSDVDNCGACGNACPYLTNNTRVCRNGFCEDECMPGWGDCDGNPGNRCETNLLVDGRNCGACGNRCDTAAGQPCINGGCLMTACDAGPVTK